MNELKTIQYQTRALDVLREYFEQCQTLSPEAAFYKITAKYSARNEPSAYHRIEAEHLSEIPYVCLRVPTGGGKTVMACRAAASALRDYKHADSGMILWLVPTKPILLQTLKALQDPAHPYYQALDSLLHNVVVKNIESALSLPVSDVLGHTCIILSTLQMFRTDDPDGRRVYRDGNSALAAHFENIPESCLPLVKINPETGNPVRSLQNLIAMHRPVIIVDEAHNARTALSLDMLDNFNPACIVEFTATPNNVVNPSNVLYSVSASELHAEHMIKMPIEVYGRSAAWRELIQDAINQRHQLEEIAKQEQKLSDEYIRPILLFQAMKKIQGDESSIHAELLKELLIKDYRLPEDQIRIAIGEKDEIENEDLASEACPVRFIITQQKLREGWDCPFAYVLCSISESFSSTQVEQLIGRIMRLPEVKQKNFAELNKAYVFAPSSFINIAESLKDALVKNGFEKFEADRMLHDNARDTGDLFGDVKFDCEPVETIIRLTAPPVEMPFFSPPLAAHAKYDPQRQTITFTRSMLPEHRNELLRIFPSDKTRIDHAYVESNRFNPERLSRIEMGYEMSVPNLIVMVAPDLFEVFNEDALQEIIEYDRTQLTAALCNADYRSTAGQITKGTIGISQDGQVTTQALPVQSLQEQACAWDMNAAANWEESDLVGWLDARIDHHDIDCTDMIAALSRLVLNLTKTGCSLRQLVVDKYNLLNAVAAALKEFRKTQKNQAFQTYLSSDFATPLTVNPDNCFRFGVNYPVNHRYTGGVRFNKHLYSVIGDMNNEEVQCAQYLDGHAKIDCWVRNLDKRPLDSFWLQTSTDRFYPDFVCRLTDGRFLAVEHKSQRDFSNDDSDEKRTIGSLWAKRSNGCCLFVMTNGPDFEIIGDLIK